MLTRLTEGSSRPHHESSLAPVKVLRAVPQLPGWNPKARADCMALCDQTPLASPSSAPQFPSLPRGKPSPAPRLGPSRQCQYCVLLATSSPPAVTAYLGSVLPSAFPLQAESEALPRTPTTLGQELQKHQAGLVLVSLPASLPADCGLATEAGHWDHRHPLGAGETCGILSPL